MTLICNNIEKRLLEKKMTTADMARETGLLKYTIQKIINKYSTPQLKTQQVIAEFFNCKVEEVFYYDIEELQNAL